LIVPATFAPVAVTTNTFGVPPTLTLTLPFDTGMSTLLVPFAMPDVPTVAKDKPPLPFVCKNCPAVPPVIPTLPTLPSELTPATVSVPVDTAPVVETLPTVAVPETLRVALDTRPPVVTLPPVIRPDVERLPTLALPVTATDVRVPTEVMFGCAFV